MWLDGEWVWLTSLPFAVYSVGPPEIVDPLIYDGLVEELVEVLEIKGAEIMVSYACSTGAGRN